MSGAGHRFSILQGLRDEPFAAPSIGHSFRSRGPPLGRSMSGAGHRFLSRSQPSPRVAPCPEPDIHFRSRGPTPSGLRDTASRRSNRCPASTRNAVGAGVTVSASLNGRHSAGFAKRASQCRLRQTGVTVPASLCVHHVRRRTLIFFLRGTFHAPTGGVLLRKRSLSLARTCARAVPARRPPEQMR